MKADWLIDRVNERISQVVLGSFFQFLGSVRDRADLSPLIHQLAHMSREFIQALLFRAARCGRREDRAGEDAFLRPFLEHVRAECLHPPELEDWARMFEFVGGTGRPSFCGVPKTSQTERLLDHIWLIAERGTAAEQVVVMNMVAEGVALVFYRAMLGVLGGLGMNIGRYWKAHKDADADHALLAANLIDVEEGSELGVRLVGLASVTLDLFEQWLSSCTPVDWVSTRADRILSLDAPILTTIGASSEVSL